MKVEGFLLTKFAAARCEHWLSELWPWVLSQSKQLPSVNLWLGVREFHGLKSASAETRHH